MGRSLFSLLVCLASAAFGSEVRLGPETPLTSLGPATAAAFEQLWPDVASNGRDFLAVWTDLREGKSAVYTSRLTTEGQPFEPFGHRVAYASAARVSSAGDDYLIVWVNFDGSVAHSQRVD